MPGRTWGPSPDASPLATLSPGGVRLDQWRGLDAPGPLRRPAELGGPDRFPGAPVPRSRPSAQPPAAVTALPRRLSSSSGSSCRLIKRVQGPCLWPRPPSLGTPCPPGPPASPEGRALGPWVGPWVPPGTFHQVESLLCGAELTLLPPEPQPVPHTTQPPRITRQILYCSAEMLTNTENRPAWSRTQAQHWRGGEVGLVLRRKDCSQAAGGLVLCSMVTPAEVGLQGPLL